MSVLVALREFTGSQPIDFGRKDHRVRLRDIGNGISRVVAVASPGVKGGNLFEQFQICLHRWGAGGSIPIPSRPTESCDRKCSPGDEENVFFPAHPIIVHAAIPDCRTFQKSRTFLPRRSLFDSISNHMAKKQDMNPIEKEKIQIKRVISGI